MTPFLIFCTVLLAFMLVFLAVLTVYNTCLVYSVFKGVPYVTTGRKRSEAMMDLAAVTEGMNVVDLGSGNGEICFAAARRGARVTGIEVNPSLVLISRLRARRLGMGDRVRFVCADIWKYPLPADTDVVCAYLLPKLYTRLLEKARSELKPGTRIVSHAFKFKEIEPVATGDSVYLYKI